MAGPRRATLSRRVRSLGGRLLRRAGILPGGMPDGLGQDAELVGRSLPHTVMVYFADTVGALYQIEQWYEPFRALSRKHPLVVVTRDSRTARRVRRDSGLDTIVVSHYTTMDDLIARSQLKVALYVNHNPENFSNLRFNTLVHASMMHGDSDKGVSVSNQTKAYDFSFVAGQAAVERMAAFSTFYDAQTRCIPVGRPQVDGQAQQRAVASDSTRLTRGGRPTVLYAPTWEGPQPSAAYGSIATHGRALLEGFVRDGWNVIFRPHPLTGVRDPAYGGADRDLRRFVERAAGVGFPDATYRVDVSDDIAGAFAEADLLVSDVSGVAMDWLPCGRPLMMTKPAAPEVGVAVSPLTALVPQIDDRHAGEAARAARAAVENDELRDDRARLVEHYLGDLRPGASLHRFIAAVDQLIEVRDREVARLEGLRT